MQNQYVREKAGKRNKIQKQENDNHKDENEKKSILLGFRIRFFLAVVLFAAFIYCDRMKITYANENTHTIYEKILDSMEIPISEIYQGLGILRN